MGMAASQARLLSITARLSDNEQSGQQLSYAKERLADRTDQVTKEYNEALKATKLQIMTGYADGAASYSDISFAMLTSEQVVSSLGKQYCVTDTKGRVLVPEHVAKAFQKAKGSLNAFLGALNVDGQGGFSVSDVNPLQKNTGSASAEDAEIVQKIHEAWDKYFHSVDKTYGAGPNDENHLWTFDYVDNSRGIGDGYAVISVAGTAISKQVVNYEGTNQEQLDLYNYALAITESYYSDTHDLSTIRTQYDQGNSSMIEYYTNLYDKMLSSGFYSYTDTLAVANNDPEHWVYDNNLYKGASASDTKGTPLDDPNTLEVYLKEGKLLLETYSKAEGKFVSTSLSADTCVQEVEDETQIAIAEAEYEDELAQIQRLDSRYDLKMKQLDTEHNTLQTEYDSVKNVITKNVESSFKTFG